MPHLQDTDPRQRRMNRRERALEIEGRLIRAGEPAESARAKAEAAAGGLKALRASGTVPIDETRGSDRPTIRSRRKLEEELRREAGGS